VTARNRSGFSSNKNATAGSGGSEVVAGRHFAGMNGCRAGPDRGAADH